MNSPTHDPRIGLLAASIVMLPLFAPVGRAQSPNETDESHRERPEDTAPLDGFWPSPRMTEFALRRWSGQIVQDYQLDRDQAQVLEEMMLRRWPAWMKKNRRLLQPVVNEFMENRIAPEPPSPERVAKWSARALDSFSSVRDELRDAQDEFRKVLSPTQKMQFDVDIAKMNVGMELLQQKLHNWQDGQYAAHELWDAPRYQRDKARDEERDSASEGDASGAERTQLAGTQPETVPLDKWESFVADFIKRYSLDQEQITSAWTVMGDLRAQAESFRERNREEYQRIEHRLAKAGDEDRSIWIERRKDLDLRIDSLFEELKNRLGRLLTDAQRSTAEKPQVSS